MTPCEEISGQLGALFTCAPHGKYVRVRTPFLYPDGDVVDLFVRDQGEETVVSDLGESLRWLRNQTLAMKRPPKQRQLIDDIKLTNDVELYKGALIARATQGDLASAIMRVGQAAVRVGDLWFTVQNRAVQSVPDDVEDFLTERSFSFERRFKTMGRSLKPWTVDFYVKDVATSYVQVLSTGSRASATVSAKTTVAMWYDLSGADDRPHNFISLIDETTADVWSTEDIRLLDSISTVQPWSKPDEFAALLRAAPVSVPPGFSGAPPPVS